MLSIYSNAKDPEVRAAYQDGFKDAWNIARKIHTCETFGFNNDQLKEIFQTDSVSYIFNNFTASETLYWIMDYEKHKFKIGDEVKSALLLFNKAVIMEIDDVNNAARIINRAGNTEWVDLCLCEKTGKSYPEMTASAELIQKCVNALKEADNEKES